MSVLKWLDDHFEEMLLVIFLVMISLVMLLQVVMRYAFNSSLTWAEEFCRYCYVWTVFISLGYTVKKDNMLRVNVVMDMLPDSLHKIINVFVQIISTAFFFVFAYQSVFVVKSIQNMNQKSTAMGWSMYLVYTCTTIGFSLGAIRSIQRLIIMLKNFNDPVETTLQATIKEAKAEVLTNNVDDLKK